MERLEQGGISLRHADRELAIGYATLKRLLDTRRPSKENKQRTLVAITTCGDGNGYDAIMATLLTKSLNSQPCHFPWTTTDLVCQLLQRCPVM